MISLVIRLCHSVNVPNDVSTNSSAEVVGGIDGRTFSSYLGGAEVAHLSRLSSCRGNRRVLFVQATNPGAYPPLIHASMLMAEAGWEVTFLSAPIRWQRTGFGTAPAHQDPRGSDPPVACDEQGRVTRFMQRRPHDWHCDFGRTLFMPRILSGAGPGLLAARLAGAALVYHEHDSPSPGHCIPSSHGHAGQRRARRSWSSFRTKRALTSRKGNCDSLVISCILCGMSQDARNWSHPLRQRSRR